MTDFDVVVVGGGPGGLQAALTLGRARRRVLVLDAGERRNAAAKEVHTFLTRDGIPPNEMRRIAHEELAHYPTVSMRAEHVARITGSLGTFHVETASGVSSAARVLLAVGMVDERMPIEGFDALWGTGIVQCPYCHGFEQRDQRFGVIVNVPGMADMAPLLLNWTDSVTAFVLPGVALTPEARARLGSRGITVVTQPIARLAGDGEHLRSVHLADGTEVPCDLLFARPPQKQTPLVRALDLRLDDAGYVWLDETRATSRPGIYAAGDLTTPMQSALAAASSGMQAAAMIVHAISAAH